MENNRYREEEKELEEQNKDTSKKEVLETEVEDLSQESSNNSKEDKVVPKKKYNKLKKKLDEKDEEISKLTEELENIKNEMLKDRAELENFKRRTNEDRLKERKYANQLLVEDLLDMIDIFDKTVNKETDDEKLSKYLIGFKMINDQIQDILNRYGLAKIPGLGQKFNPSLHEAVEVVECEGESGTIIEVERVGYMFKDRVIRPSKVKIIK